MTIFRRCAFAIVASVLALVGALVAGEIGLRIFYRDGGTKTFGAPGGGPFNYTFNGSDLRAPEPPHGAKRPGVTRIVIQGDSVTWGQGVENWYDLYPMGLLERLNKDGERYEMAVFARVGREITHHLAGLQSYPDDLSPDVLVYQWYVNDIEVEKDDRPSSEGAPWRRWPGHYWARTHSYLYFFVDDRLRLLVPGGDRSYPEYIATEYAPGTRGWTLFTEQFDRWAALAHARSPRVIVMLYPTLLANGGDPMPDIRAQVGAVARGHGFEVLDLTPHLQGFNTHASIFDSHPNGAAHQAIAAALYQQIVNPPATR